MEKIVSVQHLQDAGLLGVEYTGLELWDAFLMYWISHKRTDNNRIILRDGNHTLDIDSYFKMFW